MIKKDLKVGDVFEEHVTKQMVAHYRVLKVNPDKTYISELISSESANFETPIPTEEKEEVKKETKPVAAKATVKKASTSKTKTTKRK